MEGDVLGCAQILSGMSDMCGAWRWWSKDKPSTSVGAPFERIGVDLMEMPLTARGRRYVIVFLDYLTKWVEAYPIPDQTSETVGR